tara:strand:+ start:135 stop:389 length:255 start_codon:yes stop_codon:yes gene_type:complete
MKDKIKEICTELNNGQIAVVQATEQLFDLFGVSKRCLADVEIEYKHPTGKKKGKLKYDDDDETLILNYKGGCITLPSIEDCNVC